jgi:hypothetical protein
MAETIFPYKRGLTPF